MVSDYELVEYADPEGRPFWELTTSPENSQFQKMMSDPKTKFTARKMINQISKVYDYGLKDVSGTILAHDDAADVLLQGVYNGANLVLLHGCFLSKTDLHP